MLCWYTVCTKFKLCASVSTTRLAAARHLMSWDVFSMCVTIATWLFDEKNEKFRLCAV